MSHLATTVTTDDDLFDWAANARHRDPDTSKEAAEALSGSETLSRLQHAAMSALLRLGGRGTIEQCADLTEIEWKSLSPRFAPLIRRAFVRDTKERSVGRSGRNHRILELTERGREALADLGRF